MWADDATSVLHCRIHNHLPGEATSALGSHTAALTLANPILYSTTKPLQEVQSQPMESKIALGTILSIKQFASVSTLVREDCPMKASVTNNHTQKKNNQYLDAQHCTSDESYIGHFETSWNL